MENSEQLEEALVHIREVILKYVPARYIYFFGSYLYGEPSAESDIDIYTVIPDETQNLLFLYGDIKSELEEKKINNIDLHIIRENQYHYRKTRSMFEKTICEKGRLIYELA